MRTPGLARLIMLSGSSAGSGKSTAMRSLAERYRAAGREVMAIDEDSVWGDRRLDEEPVDHTTASPMFYDLLHRKLDNDHSPEPAEVLRLFEELVTEAVNRNVVWLQDWCWPELVGMLGWDGHAARTTSQQLLKVAAPLDPQVVYLRVDPGQALRRALTERGTVWFNRHAGIPAQAVSDSLDQLAARRRQAEPDRIAALDGWRTTFLDAATGQQQVLDSIWQVLEQSAVLGRG